MVLFWKASSAPDALEACSTLVDVPGWPAVTNRPGQTTYSVDSLKSRKAIIVVNIANKCGLTDNHYKKLQELYDKYSRNLEILAFPSNDFKQESEDQCSRTRRADFKFPVFETVHVNGPDTSNIFSWCKLKSGEFGKASSLSAIGWNFGKFLINTRDWSVKYYGPRTDPSEMEEPIKALIAGA